VQKVHYEKMKRTFGKKQQAGINKLRDDRNRSLQSGSHPHGRSKQRRDEDSQASMNGEDPLLFNPYDAAIGLKKRMNGQNDSQNSIDERGSSRQGIRTGRSQRVKILQKSQSDSSEKLSGAKEIDIGS
jgi:hypothetical protein